MTGALSESPRIVNNVEKETLIELLVRTVHHRLKRLLHYYFEDFHANWPPTKQQLELHASGPTRRLENCLKDWRDRIGKCYIGPGSIDCLTCLSCLVINQYDIGS